MFDNFENIKMIVEQLKYHEIKNLIISPGGTNIPLIKLVQKDDFFTCYSIVDERSAAYFAIGIYLQTGKPVALICTSAQATRNYIPGLTEAFYKRVPILAITMEKHSRFKYQEYMQAPDQTSLPNDCVKKSFELPYIKDINDIYFSRRMINEAILEMNNNRIGPIQLCVPWLDFKITEKKPKNNNIDRLESLEELNLNEKNILLVIGEGVRFSEEEKKAIEYFCQNTNSVVYTNHLSNFNGTYVIKGNLLLSTISDDEFLNLKPDILITFGGQTGDYPLYLKLSKTEYGDIEHWRVAKDGEIIDTYDKLTKVFKMSIETFCYKVNIMETEHGYYKMWYEKNERLNRDILLPFSNLSIAQYLCDKIPNNSIMQFSILNSLRVWNLLDIKNSVECYSNVGAFGIDGGMSTLIGQSVVSKKLSFLIIGDLAFFYDMNSLGIRHINNNLRIILINNNGGIEFKLHGEKKDETNPYIAAANHYKNAKGWAETCGFEYFAVNNMSEFKEASIVLLNESERPIIIEAFVTDDDERDAYHKLIEENKTYTKSEKFKKNLKKQIKKIIKRK